MRIDRADELVRDPEEPERATFLELLFDVVFAFALTRVSQQLLEAIGDGRRIGVMAIAETLVLLVAVWNVWIFTCWVTSRFNRLATAMHLLFSGLIVASLLLAVAMPQAFGDRGMLFAAAFVGAQVGRPIFLAVLLGGHPRRRNEIRLVCWASLSGVFWIVGAVLPHEVRLPLWAVALAVDYLGVRLGWPAPWLGREQNAQWRLAGAHLAERYQQFLILALGESVLFIGLTFSEGPLDFGRTVAFLVSVVSTLLLWQIYFQRAGKLLPEAMGSTPNPGRLGQSSNYTQFALVAGVLLTAVANELAIADPLGDTHLAFSVVVLGGPIVFLIARLRFEYEVFGRFAPPLLVGPLLLGALIPVMLLPPPLVGLVVATLLLAASGLGNLYHVRKRAVTTPNPPL
ncbi:low temperature requirement protein A [Micromonospora sp. NPDC050397]|uniref:low temperature requirement protein A n=1 Tax=Micromonospora sp. NPDC050397 TaxID=3364279 RepID=UPI00384CAE4A